MRARLPIIFCLAGLILAQTMVLRAADPAIFTNPPAAWVAPLSFNRLSAIDQAQPGEDSRQLLVDRQVNAATNEGFFHDVRQVFTPAGVKNWATFTKDFEPAREMLTFHWIRIWRGSNALNRLDPAKIRIIQPERDLEENLFYGTKSAVLFLEDVRPGDIIDCAYTIHTLRSSSGEKFTDGMYFAHPQGVEHLSMRLLWPGQRHLHMKDHGTVPKPTVVRRGNFFEYKWDLKKVAAVPPEDHLPVWYEPYPWVQSSEYNSWSEVNLWAMNLFRYTNALAPEFLQSIADWKKLPTKEARVLAALQFVQEQVRYLGIETVGSEYRPANPSDVFVRRFGDCKDKALLFVTILRALQIEAWPVLVNTRARAKLDNWQPTSAAFDHAIAQVVMDGQTHWFDCTATYQRGPLATRSIRDYERGLVIRPGTMGLTTIPVTDESSLTTVTEYFNIRTYNPPADLKIVTVAEGRDADSLRAEFATKTRDDIQRNHANSYARLYPDIKTADPLLLSDNEEENRIELTEFYTIDKFWVLRSPTDGYYCDFAAENMTQLVNRPTVSFRTMPLRVPYPRHEIFHLRATIGSTGWNKLENKNIEDPAFTFSRRLAVGPLSVNMDCEYRSLSDAVPLDALHAHLQNLDDAWRFMNYRLYPLF